MEEIQLFKAFVTQHGTNIHSTQNYSRHVAKLNKKIVTCDGKYTGKIIEVN